MSCTPSKQIKCKEDLENFKASHTFSCYLEFVKELANSVIGSSLHTQLSISSQLQSMHDILEELLLLINEFPPAADHKSRFGNPAFRCWYGELSNRLYRFHRDALKIADEDIVECSAYLLNSFGNCERIDYGTGHEATFIAWLFCLHQCGLFDKQEFSAVVLFVFQKYLSVMRALQKTYWLEPAGSHGVWGLDDYHFLPFLFGAAQLSNHKHLKPKDIHNQEYIEEFAGSYLYFDCIKFINQCKSSASLRWHSPLLDDISNAKSWEKIFQGLIKMYSADVLGKLPIMQHFLFGHYLPFKSVIEGNVELSEHECGEPICCISRLPSAMANEDKGLRDVTIPFD